MTEPEDLYPVERYRLILKHEFIDRYGKPCPIDLPFVIDHISMAQNREFYPASMAVNEMLDKLKAELLQRIGNEEEQNDRNQV